VDATLAIFNYAPWFFRGVGYLILAFFGWKLLKQIAHDAETGVRTIVSVISSEFRGLRELDLKQPGVINALAIVAVLVCAVLAFAAAAVEKFSKLLAVLFAPEDGSHPGSLLPYLVLLVFIVALVGCLSVFAVSSLSREKPTE
jgi:hypothetical protein